MCIFLFHIYMVNSLYMTGSIRIMQDLWPWPNIFLCKFMTTLRNNQRWKTQFTTETWLGFEPRISKTSIYKKTRCPKYAPCCILKLVLFSLVTANTEIQRIQFSHMKAVAFVLIGNIQLDTLQTKPQHKLSKS